MLTQRIQACQGVYVSVYTGHYDRRRSPKFVLPSECQLVRLPGEWNAGHVGGCNSLVDEIHTLSLTMLIYTSQVGVAAPWITGGKHLLNNFVDSGNFLKLYRKLVYFDGTHLPLTPSMEGGYFFLERKISQKISFEIAFLINPSSPIPQDSNDRRIFFIIHSQSLPPHPSLSLKSLSEWT